MEYRELGKTGIKTSPVCLGTWAVGGGPWWGESDDYESVKAIKAPPIPSLCILGLYPG